MEHFLFLLGCGHCKHLDPTYQKLAKSFRAEKDVVIAQEDCGTLGFIRVTDLRESGEIIRPLAERVFGRIAAEDIIDPLSGKLIAKQGELLTDSFISKIKDSSVNEIAVRSVLTCQARRGICIRCYGMDLSKLSMVDIGTSAGVIAAQSIGEPGQTAVHI